jgi:importin-5
MIDIEPKFFKKKLKELNELLQNVFKMPDLESGVKRMATEMLVDYAQKYPALFRKKKDILQNVIEMIFYHMVEISSEVDSEWASPKEGYNEDMEDDEDFETTRFGMGAIDRLIYSVGEEETMVLLSGTIQTLLASSDWRYKYTAVMALSQVGEYIEEAEKISSIMEMIVLFLSDQNPMLRYASCHAIGQISDDMQPKFQERYGLQVLPGLLNLLSDSVPRVVSHSAAALTNFLEGMKYEQVQESLPSMMNMLLQHTANGISLVKESCLSAMSSVV